MNIHRKILSDDIKIEKDENGEESIIFHPYNSLNKEITENDIVRILKNYGILHPINNFNLYKRAFIHKSYMKPSEDKLSCEKITIEERPLDCLPLSSKSNERLEFLGDGVLECITKQYLYRRFSRENEGFMTEKKIALVKNESIGKIAYDMGLHKYFIISKQNEEKQTRINLKKLGCLFESFVGALFLDFNNIVLHDEDGLFENIFLSGPGYQMAQVFIENIFEKHVDWIKLIQNDDNYKNILQVKIQKEFKTTPSYMEISHYNVVTGYHMGVYICLGQPIHNLHHIDSISLSCFNSFREIHEYYAIHGKILVFIGDGHHKIKKKAEQIASMRNLFED